MCGLLVGLLAGRIGMFRVPSLAHWILLGFYSQLFVVVRFIGTLFIQPGSLRELRAFKGSGHLASSNLARDAIRLEPAPPTGDSNWIKRVSFRASRFDNKTNIYSMTPHHGRFPWFRGRVGPKSRRELEAKFQGWDKSEFSSIEPNPYVHCIYSYLKEICRWQIFKILKISKENPMK